MYVCVVVKLGGAMISIHKIVSMLGAYPLNSKVHNSSTTAGCCRGYKGSHNVLKHDISEILMDEILNAPPLTRKAPG